MGNTGKFISTVCGGKKRLVVELITRFKVQNHVQVEFPEDILGRLESLETSLRTVTITNQRTMFAVNTYTDGFNKIREHQSLLPNCRTQTPDGTAPI